MKLILHALTLASLLAGTASAQGLEHTSLGNLAITGKEASLSNKLIGSGMLADALQLKISKIVECHQRDLMYAPARAGGNGGCAPFPEPETICSCNNTPTSPGGNGNGHESSDRASYEVRDATGKVTSRHDNEIDARNSASATGGKSTQTSTGREGTSSKGSLSAGARNDYRESNTGKSSSSSGGKGGSSGSGKK